MKKKFGNFCFYFQSDTRSSEKKVIKPAFSFVANKFKFVEAFIEMNNNIHTRELFIYIYVAARLNERYTNKKIK